jgi:tRNA-uridine 2-sulfurtransferase
VLRIEGDEIELALDEPLSAITPGQSLVLYDAAAPERVLGGGIIEASSKSRPGLPILAA